MAQNSEFRINSEKVHLCIIIIVIISKLLLVSEKFQSYNMALFRNPTPDTTLYKGSFGK